MEEKFLFDPLRLQEGSVLGLKSERLPCKNITHLTEYMLGVPQVLYSAIFSMCLATESVERLTWLKEPRGILRS